MLIDLLSVNLSISTPLVILLISGFWWAKELIWIDSIVAYCLKCSGLSHLFYFVDFFEAAPKVTAAWSLGIIILDCLWTLWKSLHCSCWDCYLLYFIDSVRMMALSSIRDEGKCWLLCNLSTNTIVFLLISTSSKSLLIVATICWRCSL